MHRRVALSQLIAQCWRGSSPVSAYCCASSHPPPWGVVFLMMSPLVMASPRPQDHHQLSKIQNNHTLQGKINLKHKLKRALRTGQNMERGTWKLERNKERGENKKMRWDQTGLAQSQGAMDQVLANPYLYYAPTPPMSASCHRSLGTCPKFPRSPRSVWCDPPVTPSIPPSFSIGSSPATIPIWWGQSAFSNVWGSLFWPPMERN